MLLMTVTHIPSLKNGQERKSESAHHPMMKTISPNGGARKRSPATTKTIPVPMKRHAKKTRRKRTKKDTSDSEQDSDSDAMNKKKRRKKKKNRKYSEEDSSSDDESSSRKKTSKKKRRRTHLDSDSSSEESDRPMRRNKSSKSMKRSPSPFHHLDDLNTGGGYVYRAIRQEQLSLGWSESPCSQCPSFDFCKDGGPVNPRDCVYYGDWLTGGMVAPMEDMM